MLPPFHSRTPGERDEALSAAEVSRCSRCSCWSCGNISRLRIDSRLINQLPSDANKVPSRNRWWAVIPLLSA